ncbi:MAG: SGNH/GDSL hydrolase family protein [Aquihabitans sp.]
MLRRLLPPLAASVGALLLWRRGHPQFAVLLVLGALGLALLAWLAPERADRLDRALKRAVQAVMSGVVAIIGVIVVVPLWAVHRVVRYDSLRSGRGWQRTGPDDSPMPFSVQRTRPQPGRWRVRGAVALLLVPIVLFAVLDREAATEAPAGIPYQPFAFVDEPWGRAAMDDYYQTRTVASSELIWEEADHLGPYYNIADGVRRSWTPERPELTVWFVGGSAAFGIGQRDDHTIASMLARDAAKDGIDLRVLNLAVTGYVSWQETGRIRRELTRRDKPDLIVIYHGSNDLATLSRRATDGVEPLDRPGNMLDLHAPGLEAPAHGKRIDDPERIADAGITILREEARATAAAAEAAGAHVATVWQPSLWSGEPNRWDRQVIEANGLYPDYLDRMHEVEDRVVAALPGVIDLRTSLDDAQGPTFFDSVHTNEAGAAIVAAALWKQLRPQVELLAAKR